MKKYFFTVAVVALFAIGFAASDEEINKSLQTEQEQSAIIEIDGVEQETETTQKEETERRAREQKEKENKRKEILAYGREWAERFSKTQTRVSSSERYSMDKCKEMFMNKVNPSTDEDFALYEEFKRVWCEEWDKVQAAKQRMDNM